MASCWSVGSPQLQINEGHTVEFLIKFFTLQVLRRILVSIRGNKILLSRNSNKTLLSLATTDYVRKILNLVFINLPVPQ